MEGPITAPQWKPNPVFFGPHGLRAGWALLIFAVLVELLAQIPAGIIAVLTRGYHTMLPTVAYDAFGAVAVLIATAIMAAIEHRSLWSYGLAGRLKLRRFGLGAVAGLAALTLLLLAMRASGHFYFGGVGESTPDALKFAALWLGGFFIVGFFEETAFRGYMQFALARGVGFWPGAIILAVLFGFVHYANPGETVVGTIAAGSFGLFLSFTLKRTGSLWWAIGFHMAWDYAESFLYSVPDSGVMVRGHLLNSRFSGPAWLTGGSVGPEGSLLIFPLLAVLAALVAVSYRRSELRIDATPVQSP